MFIAQLYGFRKARRSVMLAMDVEGAFDPSLGSVGNRILGVAGHQALHHACQEDGLHRGA